jgi:hypothetical protein
MRQASFKCETPRLELAVISSYQTLSADIAAAAAMVNEFVETTQNTNKTQLLASSNYSTFRALINSENFIHQNIPFTQLIDATSFVEM